MIDCSWDAPPQDVCVTAGNKGNSSEAKKGTRNKTAFKRSRPKTKAEKYRMTVRASGTELMDCRF